MFVGVLAQHITTNRPRKTENTNSLNYTTVVYEDFIQRVIVLIEI
jgi:hypothetical protein